MNSAKRQSYIGRTFGRLTVLRLLQLKWRTHAEAQCSCGSPVRTYAMKRLLSGKTKSCGCFRRETSAKIARVHNQTHGHCRGTMRTPTYKSYCSMKERCLNPRATGFKYWGGRGIRIAKRWLGKKGFQKFLEDVGKRPNTNFSLDRFPNKNGNYVPSNVRWATAAQQISNRRTKSEITLQEVA